MLFSLVIIHTFYLTSIADPDKSVWWDPDTGVWSVGYGVWADPDTGIWSDLNTGFWQIRMRVFSQILIRGLGSSGYGCLV